MDSLTGIVIAAITGVSALQLPAFIHAYLQRLGGHLDEARQSLVFIKGDQAGIIAEETALRDRLMATAQERIDGLETAQSAITQAETFEKPIIFFIHLDGDIALATAQSFTPALALDLSSLIFATIGIMVGWLLWGIIKSPTCLFRSKNGRAKSD